MTMHEKWNIKLFFCLKLPKIVKALAILLEEYDNNIITNILTDKKLLGVSSLLQRTKYNFR